MFALHVAVYLVAVVAASATDPINWVLMAVAFLLHRPVHAFALIGVLCAVHIGMRWQIWQSANVADARMVFQVVFSKIVLGTAAFVAGRLLRGSLRKSRHPA